MLPGNAVAMDANPLLPNFTNVTFESQFQWESSSLGGRAALQSAYLPVGEWLRLGEILLLNELCQGRAPLIPPTRRVACIECSGNLSSFPTPWIVCPSFHIQLCWHLDLSFVSSLMCFRIKKYWQVSLTFIDNGQTHTHICPHAYIPTKRERENKKIKNERKKNKSERKVPYVQNTKSQKSKGRRHWSASGSNSLDVKINCIFLLAVSHDW